MNILWLITAILHFISISFMGLCMVRLFSYVRRYRLKENRHTLLFGFVTVEHVVAIYIAMVLLFTTASVILLHYLSIR
jgi:hypothetical protein